MNDANLYQDSNILQKRDALLCLQEFGSIVKWKKYGDRIVDIGCGDGSVTNDILKKFIPPNYKKILGCDISEEMVKYANENHSSDDTKFTVLDIEGQLPSDMRGGFDHAFSFYALHWIKRQQTAFTNIYNLLAPGGDCLLTFLGHIPIYDVYRLLARTDRWHYWMRDVNRHVSPYHDTQDPEKVIKRMMEKIGFTNVKVYTKKSSFVYHSIETLKKAVLAVNPFKIPKNSIHTFMDDYVSVLYDMGFIEHKNNNINDINITFCYSLLIASGTKIY